MRILVLNRFSGRDSSDSVRFWFRRIVTSLSVGNAAGFAGAVTISSQNMENLVLLELLFSVCSQFLIGLFFGFSLPLAIMIRDHIQYSLHWVVVKQKNARDGEEFVGIYNGRWISLCLSIISMELLPVLLMVISMYFFSSGIFGVLEIYNGLIPIAVAEPPAS